MTNSNKVTAKDCTEDSLINAISFNKLLESKLKEVFKALTELKKKYKNLEKRNSFTLRGLSDKTRELEYLKRTMREKIQEIQNLLDTANKQLADSKEEISYMKEETQDPNWYVNLLEDKVKENNENTETFMYSNIL